MKTRAPRFWVMDYETYFNVTIAVFRDFVSGERRIFVVHFFSCQWQQLIDFLVECRDNGDWHFGFNNLAFDSQITEYILQNERRLRQLDDPDVITKHLHEYGGYVIEKRNNREFADFPEFKLTVRCHDIFRQNHWNNRAKSTSLKWAQFGMDWPNVEETPHDFRKPVMTREALEECVEYCINDVESTNALYQYVNGKGQKEMLEQAGLRKQLSAQFKLNLYSASEANICEAIFASELAPAMGVEVKVLKKMRTERASVALADVMLPIEFNEPDFRAVQLWFADKVVNTASGDLTMDTVKQKGPQLTQNIRGMPTTWALGGIHGCVPAGIYATDNEYDLQSADVTSFYPMLGIKNNWHPAHIPQGIFKRIYQGFFDKRSQYPKSHFLNKTFKLVLNLTYGKSKDRYSFLYDPFFTFQITINGQLQLTKLLEMVLQGIPGTKPVMANTDGFEVLIPKGNKERYYAICKEWEAMTQLSLEFVEYERMIIRDVNNYIAVWREGDKQKTKCKGAFEYEDLPLHKNKSMLVIPKALYAYFIDGVSPEDYLATNQNFFDYCAGLKLTHGWHFEEHCNEAGELSIKQHQKLLRYYISQKGNKLMKVSSDGLRQQQVEAGKWKQVVANFVDPAVSFADRDIDFRYYLQAIRSQIAGIEPTASSVVQNTKAAQLSLGF